jgi:fatty-acid desaturase
MKPLQFFLIHWLVPTAMGSNSIWYSVHPDLHSPKGCADDPDVLSTKSKCQFLLNWNMHYNPELEHALQGDMYCYRPLQLFSYYT